MKGKQGHEKVNDPVALLRSLLGKDVLFLHWPLGKKGVPRPWKHLTVHSMNDPAYLDELRTGNIGVVQGEKSGGLCSIDIDVDEDVEGFIKLNPALEGSLRSHGQRGCNIWFRVKGNVPRLKTIKTLDGKAWGEFRGEGAQTVIFGEHPSGCDYRLAVETSPVEIQVAEIVWPEHVVDPFAKPNQLALDDRCTEETEGTDGTDGTDGTEETQETDDTEGTQEIEEGLMEVSREELLAAIGGAVPTKDHSNHSHLFKLARIVKGLEKTRGRKLSPAERRAAFELWYGKSSEFLRAEQTKGDYWIEFLNSYKATKYPVGMADSEAWETASRVLLSPDFFPHFDNPDLRRVIAFCLQLQRETGTAPFFLSCRVLQRLLKHASHKTAANWLSALVVEDFLEEVAKGDFKTSKATRYLVKHWPANGGD